MCVMLFDLCGWIWVVVGNSGLVCMDIVIGCWVWWVCDGCFVDEMVFVVNIVCMLVLEKDGMLWLGGSGGLDCFDVKNECFIYYCGCEDGLFDMCV